jgi:hypothetical protein
MSLSEPKSVLEKSLRELACTSDGPYLRPFAPNLRWSESNIFVVGTNPATPLRNQFRDFNEYWQSLTQKPELFDSVYATQHTSGSSKSTKRTRRLLSLLEPHPVLVTNAIIFPSKKVSLIPEKNLQRIIGHNCFELLLNVCSPKVILFYGSEAVGLAASIFGITLDRYEPMVQQKTISKSGTHLFAFPHFSGQGVQPGYRVSEMDMELELFAKRARQIIDS